MEITLEMTRIRASTQEEAAEEGRVAVVGYKVDDAVQELRVAKEDVAKEVVNEAVQEL